MTRPFLRLAAVSAAVLLLAGCASVGIDEAIDDTNASAAASQAATAAQDAMQRERAAARRALPSVFTVRVLGFGNEPAEGAGARGTQGASAAGYDPQGVVQVLGAGELTATAMQSLSPNERRALKR